MTKTIPYLTSPLSWNTNFMIFISPLRKITDLSKALEAADLNTISVVVLKIFNSELYSVMAKLFIAWRRNVSQVYGRSQLYALFKECRLLCSSIKRKKMQRPFSWQLKWHCCLALCESCLASHVSINNQSAELCIYRGTKKYVSEASSETVLCTMLDFQFQLDCIEVIQKSLQFFTSKFLWSADMCFDLQVKFHFLNFAQLFTTASNQIIFLHFINHLLHCGYCCLVPLEKMQCCMCILPVTIFLFTSAQDKWILNT